MQGTHQEIRERWAAVYDYPPTRYRHATAEERGKPVAGTWCRKWHSRKNRAGRNNGVMGNSRIVAHRYMDELDNGPAHRREIKRREARMWRAEWKAEQDSERQELVAYASWE